MPSTVSETTTVEERLRTLSGMRDQDPDLARIHQASESAARLRLDACAVVEYATKLLESARKDIALMYARSVGGTPVEHEMGECLALVRKAEKRLLAAYTELAQQELPLE